jgi:hypothetical protein
MEALGLFHKLADSKYAGEVARVEASLDELAREAPSQ